MEAKEKRGFRKDTLSNAAKGSGRKETEKFPEDLVTRTTVLLRTVVTVVRWVGREIAVSDG